MFDINFQQQIKAYVEFGEEVCPECGSPIVLKTSYNEQITKAIARLVQEIKPAIDDGRQYSIRCIVKSMGTSGTGDCVSKATVAIVVDTPPVAHSENSSYWSKCAERAFFEVK